MSKQTPRILFLDIETSPLEVYSWGLFDQNIALNQIKNDWMVLSVAGKWAGEKKVHYWDKRNDKDDTRVLEGIWKLLDEADICVSQNGKRFDHKKLNARFILRGMEPPSSFQIVDTLVLAKKYFAFTSNKLEYLSDKLCTKYKKLKHSKFAGFDLWKECLKGNIAAWNEMEKYNKHDVLALEELYTKLAPYSNITLDIYQDGQRATCSCGSQSFSKNGYKFLSQGKYQRYKCNKCGSERRSKENLIPKGSIKSVGV